MSSFPCSIIISFKALLIVRVSAINMLYFLSILMKCLCYFLLQLFYFISILLFILDPSIYMNLHSSLNSCLIIKFSNILSSLLLVIFLLLPFSKFINTSLVSIQSTLKTLKLFFTLTVHSSFLVSSQTFKVVDIGWIFVSFSSFFLNIFSNFFLELPCCKLVS